MSRMARFGQDLSFVGAGLLSSLYSLPGSDISCHSANVWKTDRLVSIISLPDVAPCIV